MTHLDVKLVELHQRDRLPGAAPAAVTKDELDDLSHLAPLVRTYSEPALGPEHVDVGTEDGPRPLHAHEAVPYPHPARDEVSVNRVALGRDLFHGQPREGDMHAQAFVYDGLSRGVLG